MWVQVSGKWKPELVLKPSGLEINRRGGGCSLDPPCEWGWVWGCGPAQGSQRPAYGHQLGHREASFVI